MKLKQVEHYDVFGDEITFWLEVSDMTQAIQDKAREIDGENFSPDCFGICVGYEAESGEFSLSTDGRDWTGAACNVYYIDNDGDKHWFHADMTQAFLKQIFAACNEAIGGKGKAQKPSVRDALQNLKRTAAEHPVRDAKKKADRGAR